MAYKSRKTRRKWSVMELAYLQEAWETDVSLTAIAHHLVRTAASCRQQAYRMGIKRTVGVWLR